MALTVAHLESHRGGLPSIIPTCNEAACCSRADNNAHNSLSTLARNLSSLPPLGFPWNRSAGAPERPPTPPISHRCLFDFNQISLEQKL